VRTHANARNRAVETGENVPAAPLGDAISSNRTGIRRDRLPALPRSEHHVALPQSRQRPCCSVKPTLRRSTAMFSADTAE